MERIDVDALYAALESRKSERDLSWRKLADEIGLTDHTVFSRMSRGQVPPANTLLAMADWLGTPLEVFRQRPDGDDQSRARTMQAIESYLRADKTLTPESADAISQVLQAAFDELDDQAPARSALPVR